MNYTAVRLRARDAQQGRTGMLLLMLFLTGMATAIILGVTSNLPATIVGMFQAINATRNPEVWQTYPDMFRGSIFGPFMLVLQIVGWLAVLVIEAFKTYSWLAPVRRGRYELDDGLKMIREATFTRVFQTVILIGLYTFLWSMLFVIPGIVKSYAYSMSLYILLDRPDLGPRQAIRASQDLMRGKKGGLFGLEVMYQLIIMGTVLMAFVAGFAMIVLGFSRENPMLAIGGFFVIFGSFFLVMILSIWVQLKVGLIRAAFYEEALAYHGQPRPGTPGTPGTRLPIPSEPWARR